MSREQDLLALERFVATELRICEQQQLLRNVRGAENAVYDLRQEKSQSGQAQALMEILERYGLVDASFFDALVEYLPHRYERLCELAAALHLAPPTRPGPRARREGIGRRLPVLAFTSPIGVQGPGLTSAEMELAIAPDVPDGEIARLDLDAADLPDGSPQSWQRGQRRLSEFVEGFRRFRLGNLNGAHVPVFAFGNIPSLVAFGYALGNKIPIQVMQRYNWLTPSWGWHNEAPPGGAWRPSQCRVEGDPQAKDVGLMISVSGLVRLELVQKALPAGAPVWEIRLDDPFRDQIRAETQLHAFRIQYNRLVDQLCDRYGPDLRLHLFSAVPVAVAVELGRTLIPKQMPTLEVYDLRSVPLSEGAPSTPSFIHALTLSPPTLPG